MQLQVFAVEGKSVLGSSLKMQFIFLCLPIASWILVCGFCCWFFKIFFFFIWLGFFGGGLAVVAGFLFGWFVCGLLGFLLVLFVDSVVVLT